MGRRQRTAFPPNFVHSLDGSHMMMTAVACRKAGLIFAGSYCLVVSDIQGTVALKSHFFYSIAGVHDSYWTHACDVDQMNRILREKFVELYEKPILENVIPFSLYHVTNVNVIHPY